MPQTPATWRTFAALLERHRDHEAPFTPNEVATQAGLSLGATNRELQRLARVGAVDLEGADGEEISLTGLPVEDAGTRLETLDALSDDEYDGITDALESGSVDPEVLHDIPDARAAAKRALGVRRAE